MELLIEDYGLITLFFLGFAASTLLPLGSEWLLVLLIAKGEPPVAAVICATAGNTLGALSTYLIGHLGSDFLISRVLRINHTQLANARRVYTKWGIWTLLFSWLPAIGDPFCLVAGMFKTSLWQFSALVTVGKAVRYIAVALIALQAF